MSGAYTYAARLIRVKDGDSAILDVDLGFYTHQYVDVRLAGIDAPERSDFGWDAARAHLYNLLDNWPLTLSTAKAPGDRYGRWLGTIVSHHDTGPVLVNERMVADGHAVAYSGGARS